jgi:hypothetical protein
MKPEVAAVFERYPPKFRRKLLALRKLILETAEETRSGSTIRIDWKKKAPDEYSIYFHCQADLIETFRLHYPGCFRFDGNRRIVFGEDDRVPVEPLSACIAAALTYHRGKKSRR